MLEDLIYNILWGGFIILVIFVSMVIAFHQESRKKNKGNSEFEMDDLLDRSDEKKDQTDHEQEDDRDGK